MSAAAVAFDDWCTLSFSDGGYPFTTNEGPPVGAISQTKRGPEESTSSDAPSTTTRPESVSIASNVEHTLRAFLERRLRSLSEVRRVNVSERENRGHRAIHVWTVLSGDDRATRFKVYEIEQQLVDHFPDLLFEFHSHKEREDAPEGDTKVYDSRG